MERLVLVFLLWSHYEMEHSQNGERYTLAPIHDLSILSALGFR